MKAISKTKLKNASTPIEPEDTITIKHSSFFVAMGAWASGPGLLVGFFAWGNAPAQLSASPSAIEARVAQAPAATPAPIKYNIATDGFPSIGPADAPIVVVDFGDYQCPFCAQWHDSTYQPLMAAYPGKIRLVYRNFPLPFHQNAFMAAEAAMCAGDQNAYWKYHDKLFSNNNQLNNQAGTVLCHDTYYQLAADLGLDVNTFDDCLKTDKYKQAVQSDLDYANSLPPDSSGQAAVGGTPTFFIYGFT